MAESPTSDIRGKRRTTLVILVVAVLILVGGAAVYTLSTTSTSRNIAASSTQFSTSAAAVVSGAASQEPAGYTLESSKSNPQPAADWAVLGATDGSVANMTVLSFASSNDSQSYYARLVASLRGLPGYTDISPSLSQYQQYGKCYGYGEDVDGIAVTDGVCAEGNLVLQVHLVSSKAFTDLEVDMVSLMGAMYQSLG